MYVCVYIYIFIFIYIYIYIYLFIYIYINKLQSRHFVSASFGCPSAAGRYCWPKAAVNPPKAHTAQWREAMLGRGSLRASPCWSCTWSQAAVTPFCFCLIWLSICCRPVLLAKSSCESTILTPFSPMLLATPCSLPSGHGVWPSPCSPWREAWMSLLPASMIQGQKVEW